MVVEVLNLSTNEIGFNPTQEEIQEQIQELPKVKPTKVLKLTFKDVAPRWSTLIPKLHKEAKKYGYATDEIRLKFQEEYGVSLVNHKMCLVGESHGFNDNYNNGLGDEYCEVCSCFASMPAISAVNDKTGISYKWFKQEFMKHYNEVHL